MSRRRSVLRALGAGLGSLAGCSAPLAPADRPTRPPAPAPERLTATSGPAGTTTPLQSDVFGSVRFETATGGRAPAIRLVVGLRSPVGIDRIELRDDDGRRLASASVGSASDVRLGLDGSLVGTYEFVATRGGTVVDAATRTFGQALAITVSAGASRAGETTTDRGPAAALAVRVHNDGDGPAVLAPPADAPAGSGVVGAVTAGVPRPATTPGFSCGSRAECVVVPPSGSVAGLLLGDAAVPPRELLALRWVADERRFASVSAPFADETPETVADGSAYAAAVLLGLRLSGGELARLRFSGALQYAGGVHELRDEGDVTVYAPGRVRSRAPRD